MSNFLKILPQYLVPQHAFSRLMGYLIHCKIPAVKSWMINTFIRRYNVDMQQAIESNPQNYIDFHTFFTRHLKPALRPITSKLEAIASPVDGTISQVGQIQSRQIFQAKGFYFDLNTLLGGDENLAHLFENGHFCTVYLSPRDYHRVHMPLSGTLKKMTYVPGKLFSVNPLTTETVPALFARNERVVCHFHTQHGEMIVILVGAMLVGSICTTWAGTISPPHVSYIQEKTYENENIHLNLGDELGYFSLGSTVIVLFQKDRMQWNEHMKPNQFIQMGEQIGTLKL